MNVDPIKFDLFDNIPLFERWRGIGVKRILLILVSITWVPVALLSILHRPEVFYADTAMHMKFLVALPLLILAPLIIKNRLGNLVNHFIDSGIIRVEEHEKFKTIVNSTIELRDSLKVRVFIWVMIYCLMIFIMQNWKPELLTYWRAPIEGSHLPLSPAGLWFNFISQPIHSFIQFYFLYRVLLWGRLLFLTSLFDLQLKAPHGDDTGGLIFIGGSIKVFYVPVLAFSTSIAIGALNLILNKQFEVVNLQLTVLLLICLNVALFIIPLFSFYRPMMKAKAKGVLNYGSLGGHQLEAFEKRWLFKSETVPAHKILEGNEFSTVADTAAIISKVYKMRSLPFTRNLFLGLVLCTVLPFIPVLAVKLEWSFIFKQLLKILM